MARCEKETNKNKTICTLQYGRDERGYEGDIC